MVIKPMLIDKILKKLSRNYKIKVKTYQSNHEGDIIDYIQNKYQKFDAIIINPGALTHYSYAPLDCINLFPYQQLKYT